MFLPDPITVPPNPNLYFPLSSFPINQGKVHPPSTLPKLLVCPSPPAVSSSSAVPMLAPSQVPVDTPAESLALYSQSLRDYTLRLWVESRRQAEERVHGRNRKKSHGTTKAPLPTSSRKPSDDGNSSTGSPNDVLMLPTDGPRA